MDKRIDFVLVYSRKAHEEDSTKKIFLDNYIKGMQNAGLQIEIESGTVYTDLMCVKISANDNFLKKSAELFNIESTFNNPNYKYRTKIRRKWMVSPISHPNPESDIYKRAKETLSGEKPTTYTNAERILITEKVLKTIKFDNKKISGYNELIFTDVIKTAYPLHDSPFSWTTEGPLSDRQLLAQYWANPRYFYTMQPITLVEQYFGTEVGFYFWWVGFYTEMLVSAAIMGLIAFIIGVIYFFYVHNDIIEDEICQSELLICRMCMFQGLCPHWKLKKNCNLSKMAYIIDNPATIIFAVLISYWGIIFISKWKRKEWTRRLRWNINASTVEHEIRPDFLRSNPKMIKSSITGEYAYKPSKKRLIIIKIIVYGSILILMLFYIISMLLVIIFRIYFMSYSMQSENNFFKRNLLIFESFSSAAATVVILSLFDKMCSTMTVKLTEWENPQTQLEYDDLLTTKLVWLSLTTTFFPLMYLSYFKGHAFVSPGTSTFWTFYGKFEIQCPPSGCITDISFQLLTVMIYRNFTRNFKDVIGFFTDLMCKKIREFRSRESRKPTTQWEEDYMLKPQTRNFLYSEYITMIIQYGMIVFFVAAFPFAPLLAMVNNVIELRIDAYKFIKLYRRNIPRRVEGIGIWVGILEALTICGTISNPLIIALTSTFVPRYLYYREHKSFRGFINSTLSVFNINDVPPAARSDENLCYYVDKRFPADHPNKYELTPDFWFHMSIKCVVFIVLENVCLLFSLFLKYVVPIIPRKVQLQMAFEQKLLRQVRSTPR